MRLLISMVRRDKEDKATVTVLEDEEIEQWPCEGCGMLTSRLYEDDAMNMLCSACIALFV